MNFSASLPCTATAPGGRLAALDGLRGIAVAAVLGYHLRLGAFEAGFLGVDLFFVISGFIITSRLLDEHRQRGAIDMRAFYVRRLWRLYPPLLVLLVLCLPLTAWLAPDAFHRLVLDAPAGFLYLSNVCQLWSAQPYFESMGREPVLRHLWSLAVEQHYYMAWPPLMVVLLRWGGLRAAGVLAALLAVASALEMYRLYEVDPRAANFVYLATHTHASGVLTGSALACAMCAVGWRQGGFVMSAAPVLGFAGAASLLGFGVLVVQWNESVPWVFNGGFLLVSVLSGMMIAATLVHAGLLGRLLTVAPLHWLGTRSYSIYLWHWPLCVWIFDGPADMDPTGIRAATILVLSGLLGEFSYRFVEHGARRAVQGLGQRFTPLLSGASLWVGVGAVLFALQAWMPPPAATSSVSIANLQDPMPVDPAPLEQPPETAADQADDPAAEPPQSPRSEAEPQVAGMTVFGDRDPVFVFGDSVVLGAKSYLIRSLPGAKVDAEVGRQMSELPRLIEQMRQRLPGCPDVVIHLGTNGYIFEAHLRKVLWQLSDCRRVVLVNVFAARRWTGQNNEMITRMSREFSNVSILSWNALGGAAPHYFVQDGIHLSGSGIAAYTRAIAQALGRAPVVVPVVARASVSKQPAEPGASPQETEAPPEIADPDPAEPAPIPAIDVPEAQEP